MLFKKMINKLQDKLNMPQTTLIGAYSSELTDKKKKLKDKLKDQVRRKRIIE